MTFLTTNGTFPNDYEDRAWRLQPCGARSGIDVKMEETTVAKISRAEPMRQAARHHAL
jgi:hypothetical protein